MRNIGPGDTAEFLMIEGGGAKSAVGANQPQPEAKAAKKGKKPPQPSPPVKAPDADEAPTSVTAQWTMPEDAPTSCEFEVQYGSLKVGTWKKVPDVQMQLVQEPWDDGTTLYTCQVGGLEPGRQYALRVRARNDADKQSSSWSKGAEPLSTTLPTPSPLAQAPGVEEQPKSVTVQWTMPSEEWKNCEFDVQVRVAPFVDLFIGIT
jgi:hypothetical protein